MLRYMSIKGNCIEIIYKSQGISDYENLFLNRTISIIRLGYIQYQEILLKRHLSIHLSIYYHCVLHYPVDIIVSLDPSNE